MSLRDVGGPQPDDRIDGAQHLANVCVCGHAREIHEHFRQGSDCGACGGERCPRFRGRSLSSRMTRRFRGPPQTETGLKGRIQRL